MIFWMGWMMESFISYWLVLATSVRVGYGILCISVTRYQYVIDAYGVYSASALASVTLMRYIPLVEWSRWLSCLTRIWGCVEPSLFSAA